MYENYKQMSADEKAQVKAIHKAIRAEAYSRSGNLAWAFVRGFPYRRVERKTRTQVMPDGKVFNHNPPSASSITAILAKHIPGFATFDPARPWATPAHPDIVTWLKNPDGAIPAPPPRVKKPYVAPEKAPEPKPPSQRPSLLQRVAAHLELWGFTWLRSSTS